MSQHDFNIANQGFPAFRTDLNNGLTALATNSSGATAPSTTYAYQWWYDTTTDILKMRNADNDAWINFATFDQVNDLWSVTSLRATTEVRTPAILDATGGNTATINGIPLRQGVLDPENRIINGAFDFWQRGTSFTASGYGADRWVNTVAGGTATMSRQAFSLGDTLGSNSPTYFLRQTVSGQSSAGDIAAIVHRIEGVRSYAGQTITILGWARRSSGSGNMAVEVSQNFGTGGSPSSESLITPQAVTLTSSFAPFALTFSMPSIAGKTLGTNNNDFFGINIFTSAGSNYNARTNSLGIQTIGVDLWGIHIKQGTHTTAAADLYRQPELGPELARCQRYYFKLAGGGVNNVGFSSGAFASTTTLYTMQTFPVTMRAAPSFSFSSLNVADGVSGISVSSTALTAAGTNSAQLGWVASSASFTAKSGGYVYTAGGSGFIAGDAEL